MPKSHSIHFSFMPKLSLKSIWWCLIYDIARSSAQGDFKLLLKYLSDSTHDNKCSNAYFNRIFFYIRFFSFYTCPVLIKCKWIGNIECGLKILHLLLRAVEQGLPPDCLVSSLILYKVSCERA